MVGLFCFCFEMESEQASEYDFGEGKEERAVWEAVWVVLGGCFYLGRGWALVSDGEEGVGRAARARAWISTPGWLSA